MSMNQVVRLLLEGKAEHHILPFLWLHGAEEQTLRRMMAAIDGANCKAVCIESRPHPDFCGPGWWADMDVILDEAHRRKMKVWILDDSHFPTGYAAGAVKAAPSELCRQSFICCKTEMPEASCYVSMDLRESGLMKPPGPDLSDPLQAYGAQLPPARIFDQATDRILSVTATTKDGTTIELTDHVSGTRLEWDKPKGIYQICVLSLSHNAGYHRDNINMTEERSVRLLLDAVYEPHWQHYAADFGKTIAGFFSDEPELGNVHLYAKGNTLGCEQDLPWGPTLEQKFATEYGAGWRSALSAGHMVSQPRGCDTSATSLRTTGSIAAPVPASGTTFAVCKGRICQESMI